MGDRHSRADITRAVLGARLHIITKFCALIADPLIVSKLKLTHNFPARQIDNAVTKAALSHSTTLSRTSEK